MGTTKIKVVGFPKTEDPRDLSEKHPGENYVRVSYEANPIFPSRLDDEPQGYYLAGPSIATRFFINSDVDYAKWLEVLCALFASTGYDDVRECPDAYMDMPFHSLVWADEASVVYGPRSSAQLYREFKYHANTIEAEVRRAIDDYDLYDFLGSKDPVPDWMTLYGYLQYAFAIAADSGFVVFSA